MVRPLSALVLVTIAAPYLVAFFMVVHSLTFGIEPASLLAVPLVGTGGLIILGIPTFLLSWLLAVILTRARLVARWQVVAVGAVYGCCLVGFLFSPDTPKDQWETLPSGFMAGAVCGWIYWRIALKPASPQAV